MDLVATLRDRWKNLPGRRDGLPASSLAAFEAKHSIVLPRELRAYFLELDGFEDYVMDDEGTSFWRLGSRLIPIAPSFSDFIEKYVKDIRLVFG